MQTVEQQAEAYSKTNNTGDPYDLAYNAFVAGWEAALDALGVGK